MTRLDDIFNKKGITTYYNTLGLTEDLRKKYIGFTRSILTTHKVQKSNHVKLQCYREICTDITERKKLTGFEKFSALEFKIRLKLKNLVSPNPDTSISYDNNETTKNSVSEYLELLILEIKKESKSKLLYLSGGLDSELLAYIFLNNNIEFVPIIFQWIDNDTIYNSEETIHAFNFCNKHNIIPIIKNFNVNEFWNSEEFISIAKEFNIPSPHVITHLKTINIINEEFPNFAHYFGGEVRYIIDIPRDENTKLDLVFSEKLQKNIIYSFPGGPNPLSGNVIDSTYFVTSVFKDLYYGWTNMALVLNGAGGFGGDKFYSASLPGPGTFAGGGGGGGQVRALTLTKPTGTQVGKIYVNAGRAGPAGGGGANPTTINLYTPAGDGWKTISAYGGGEGFGSFDPARGGTGYSGSNNAESGDSEYIGGYIGGGLGGSSTGFFTGGGGAGPAGRAGTDPTVSAGGNGINGFTVYLAVPGSPNGQFGAGGGGGGAPGTPSSPGGVGGNGSDFGSFTGKVAGDGGDGSALGNGGNASNFYGAGGGGCGGGSSAGAGSDGQMRMSYWTT